MWIFLKLLAAGVMFLNRMSSRTFETRSWTAEEVDGENVKVSRSVHKGKTTETQFAVKLKVPFVFRMTREKWYDLLFKALGTSVEIQSGDPAFDQLIYVASDQPEFAHEIQSNAHSRMLITRLFLEDCLWVSCDGRFLIATFKGDVASTDKILKRIVALKKQFATSSSRLTSFLHDPFARRALLIEALIWSFAGYAIVGSFEWHLTEHDIHFDSSAVVRTGLAIGALLGGGLLAVVKLLLPRSSRSHRIFVESLLVICFSLPYGGIRLASDLNRWLDTSPPVRIEARISGIVEQITRHSKGTSYRYHMSIDSTDSSEFRVPSELEVNRAVYRSAGANKSVPIIVRRGWLKHPWIQSVGAVEY